MSRFWRRFAAISAGLAAAVLVTAGTPIPASAAIVYDQWQNLGGIITGAPDVVQLADGTLVYVAVGSDQSVWMRQVSPDGSTMTDWTSLGGTVLGGIGASNAMVEATDTGRIDIFAVGTDNAVWYKTFMAATNEWSAWQSIGGIATSDPTAMAFGDPDDTSDTSDFVLEAFVRGTDNSLWRNTFTNADGLWTGWTSLGGVLRGGPGAGGNPTAFIGNVAVRGTDDAVWYRDYDAELGTFSPWFSVGGIVNEDPEGEFLCTATFFARGTDNAVWTKALEPDTAWTSLGGIARSGPGSHEMVFTNSDDTADWVVAVRGNNNGLWALRHRWFPDESHCLAASGSGSGSGGGPGGPQRKPPKATPPPPPSS